MSNETPQNNQIASEAQSTENQNRSVYIDPTTLEGYNVKPITIKPTKKFIITLFSIFFATVALAIFITRYNYFKAREEIKPKQLLLPTPTATFNNDPSVICTSSGGEWIEEYKECESTGSDTGIDKTTCTKLGGLFNECNSACRYSEDSNTVCTQVCIQTCTF